MRCAIWPTLLRVWQRGVTRKAALIVTVLSIPPLALLIAGAFFHNHSSRVIDAQLHVGHFATRSISMALRYE